MKSADYGIDGPIVLINLIIIAILAVLLGSLAYNRILPVRSDYASAIGKFCIFITAFNLSCLLLSLWSSKIGKIKEAKRLLDMYDWKGDEKVLDVGCGRGLMLISVAKRLTTGKAVGVDIWDSRDQAGNRPENTFKNAQLEAVAERIEIKNSDARQLQFEDNSFDVVLSNKVFHNITDRKERKMAVQEIARVLKPGGWLGIIDSFQYAVILTDIGWKNVQASGRRFHMFPPVKWTIGIKPQAN
jgi:ubiquinone/menaquinone biosynthesis C-methylase UbiE